MKQDTILVLDFGGQYCHLIARRVREKSVYSEIVPSDISVGELNQIGKRLNVKGIILSGGPSSIYERNAPKMDKYLLESGIPTLGLCYGHQLIAHYLGGEVSATEFREFGTATARIRKSSGILKGLEKREQVWMSHGDTVWSIPKGFEVMASTSSCPVAAFASSERHLYGIQWHPEVVHTKNGGRIFSNFLFDVCKCNQNWKVGNLLNRYVGEVRRQVKGEKAIIALSGGVDSMTTGAIASKAIGKRLIAVFVDHGFMREGEPEQISRMAKKLKITYMHVDARRRFLRKLKGITSPEQKRKVIGSEFIKVFEEIAGKANAAYLLQGTIYPDRIESGRTKNAAVIKTHHNVGGMPANIKFKGLIEPLQELYKDEVRKLASSLGLPDRIVNRPPFPGPGLAVRIIGEVTPEKLEMLRKADSIVTHEIESAGLDKAPYQYFAVLTDTKSTGVKGDARAYGHTIAIRAVDSTEAMTAMFSRIPYETLERISTRITNEIKDVVRVVYDITNKPPSTIEWE